MIRCQTLLSISDFRLLVQTAPLNTRISRAIGYHRGSVRILDHAALQSLVEVQWLIILFKLGNTTHPKRLFTFLGLLESRSSRQSKIFVQNLRFSRSLRILGRCHFSLLPWVVKLDVILLQQVLALAKDCLRLHSFHRVYSFQILFFISFILIGDHRFSNDRVVLLKFLVGVKFLVRHVLITTFARMTRCFNHIGLRHVLGISESAEEHLLRHSDFGLSILLPLFFNLLAFFGLLYHGIIDFCLFVRRKAFKFD